MYHVRRRLFASSVTTTVVNVPIGAQAARARSRSTGAGPRNKRPDDSWTNGKPGNVDWMKSRMARVMLAFSMRSFPWSCRSKLRAKAMLSADQAAATVTALAECNLETDYIDAFNSCLSAIRRQFD